MCFTHQTLKPGYGPVRELHFAVCGCEDIKHIFLFVTSDRTFRSAATVRCGRVFNPAFLPAGHI